MNFPRFNFLDILRPSAPSAPSLPPSPLSSPDFPRKAMPVLFVVITVLVVILAFQLFNPVQKAPAPTTSGITAPVSPINFPIVNPSSKTAAKYFNVESSAADFREDGSLGDFTIGMRKKDKTAEVSWDDKNISVTQVSVVNLGAMNDLQDHRVVFNLSNVDLRAALLPPGQELTPPDPSKLPVLKSPYTIGTLPEGFFNTTYYDETITKNSPIFASGARYFIELIGRNKDNAFKMATYTFDY